VSKTQTLKTLRGAGLVQHSILHDIFKELLGAPVLASDCLDLATLVSSTSFDSPQAASLIRPFYLAEIHSALFSMKDNSSPGPDGFGPAFFKRNWELVKDTLIESLQNFHALDIVLRPSTNLTSCSF
jgi:hypothetical protein